MYDRAPRRVATFRVGSTAESVGPGSYDPLTPSRAKIKSDGFAPFSSMAGRDTSMVTDVALMMPGPGAYDQSLPAVLSKFKVPKGGGSLANRSRRFEESGADIPGPGAYEVVKSANWKRDAASKAASSSGGGGGGVAAGGSGGKYSKTPAATSMPDLRKAGEVVVNNRLKFLRKPEAPSIPTPGQAYGYEENDDGTLRKQDPPDRDGTLGPAFYTQKPENAHTRAAKLYKGNFFGNKTARRDFNLTANVIANPGPADYDVISAALKRAAATKEPSQMALAHVTGLGALQKPEAKLPRYHEIVTGEASKHDFPGPGRYHMASQFDPKPKVTFDGYEVEHPPFGTQQKRFIASPEAGGGGGGGATKVPPLPGPTSYSDPRTALEAPKKLSSLKKCPFNQTALRFDPHPSVRTTPGPGQYNLVGLAAESVKKAYFASTTKGAFGSTEVRKNSFLGSKRDEEAPGPAQYVARDKARREAAAASRGIPKKPTAAFASRSKRLEKPGVDNSPGIAIEGGGGGVYEDTPAPGAYDVVESYQRVVDKKPSQPRTEEAKRRQASFLSSTSRMAAPTVNAPLPAIGENTPGPGTYGVPPSPEPKAGKFVFKEQRFKDVYKPEPKPGPAHYELSPQVQDTVLKSTFNVTLSNPIAQKLEERHRTNMANPSRLMMGAA